MATRGPPRSVTPGNVTGSDHGSEDGVRSDKADPYVNEAEYVSNKQAHAIFEANATDQTVRSLLNQPDRMNVNDVTRLAQAVGMKEETINAIREHQINGDTWRQIMKQEVSKQEWKEAGERLLKMSVMDNIRYNGMVSALKEGVDVNSKSSKSNQQPKLDDITTGEITGARWKRYLETVESWMERNEQGASWLSRTF